MREQLIKDMITIENDAKDFVQTCENLGFRRITLRELADISATCSIEYLTDKKYKSLDKIFDIIGKPRDENTRIIVANKFNGIVEKSTKLFSDLIEEADKT